MQKKTISYCNKFSKYCQIDFYILEARKKCKKRGRGEGEPPDKKRTHDLFFHTHKLDTECLERKESEMIKVHSQI